MLFNVGTLDVSTPKFGKRIRIDGRTEQGEKERAFFGVDGQLLTSLIEYRTSTMTRSRIPRGVVISGCCRIRSTSVDDRVDLGKVLGCLGSSISVAGLKGWTKLAVCRRSCDS